MKTSFLILSLALMSLGLAGCKDPAEQLTRALNLTVDVEPSATGGAELDECMHGQVQALIDEYKGLADGVQAEIRSQLRKRYSLIVLKRTQVGQTVTGDLTMLSYVRYSPDGGRGVTLGSKALLDTRQFDGPKPRTELVSPRYWTLEIRPKSKLDVSLRRFYRTHDVDFYDRSESVTDAAFVLGRQAGAIRLSVESATPTRLCGAFASLSDLIRFQE
jgi:hypothetical protein